MFTFRERGSRAIGSVLHFGSLQPAAVDAPVAGDCYWIVNRNSAHNQIFFHIRRQCHGILVNRWIVDPFKCGFTCFNWQIIADGVYYLTANFIGIYTKCLNEITLRRAFFGRRDCIESTIYLEFEKSQEVAKSEPIDYSNPSLIPPD